MMFSRMKFTDSDFKFIQGLLLEKAGIKLNNDKRELVYSRLARRLRHLGLRDFSIYCDLVRQTEKNELQHCINAITTNHTSFFREDHHFEFLKSTILPQLAEKSLITKDKTLRIWSAGCSSGEEPYSIAITLKEFSRQLDQWNIEILATDLDSNILKQAEAGVFRRFEDKDPSFSLRKRWFQKGKGNNEGLIKIIPEIRKLVKFEQMNLNGPWSLEHKFDVIFCRNVMIYFENEIKKEILERFSSALVDDGYLIVGHSESLTGLTTSFTPMGATIHRNKA